MESVVKQQTEGQPPDRVEELVLDDWRGSELSPEAKTLLESFENLEFLSLRGSGLTSLSNFPENKSLFKLDLSHNQLNSNLEPLSRIQALMHISLESNLISSLEALNCLTALPDLKILDVLGNPVAQTEDYRDQVFKILPSLRIVDGHNQQGQEVSDILATLYQQEVPQEASGESEEEEDEEGSDSYSSSDDETNKRPRKFETSQGPLKKPKSSE